MTLLTFNCEVITPMFLCGANPAKTELRAASVKGALRFWWRAMNGNLPLDELKKRESEIFGGVGDNARRSGISIRVKMDDYQESYKEFDQVFFTYDGNERRPNGKAFPTNAMFYLGYGPANYVKEEKRAMFVRPYIPVGTPFQVQLLVKTGLKHDALQTMQALEQFGGIGAKSRNAFGCFRIKACDIDGKKTELTKFDIPKFANGGLSSFTAFSSKVNVFRTKKQDFLSWELAFKDICMAYQYARENIEPWHSWLDRELIALPIVVKNEREVDDNFLERHAKPYFLHISKTPSGYKGEILLLPYDYLKTNTVFDITKLPTIKAEYFDALNRFNDLLKTKLTQVIVNNLP